MKSSIFAAFIGAATASSLRASSDQLAMSLNNKNHPT